MSEKPGVCPVERSGKLDHSFRRLIQNPRKILKPYIKSGMTAMDLGCGPGYFTTEIARMLGGSGKVIAVDLQQGMLDILSNKIQGTDMAEIIELHKCREDSIAYSGKVDFILAFYVVHEIPDQASLFKELATILDAGGSILIVEPRFHVNKKAFREMIKNLNSRGFKTIKHPKIFFSRAVQLQLEDG